MGDAFADLHASIDAHRDAIFRYVRRLIRDADEAEDLTQDTLLRAHERVETLESEAKLTAWLYRIATNLCTDRFRSAAYRHQPTSLHTGAEEEGASALVGAPPADAPRLDLAMQQDEMGTCVRRYLDGLSDSYRAVILLHDVQGLTNVRIAEMLGVSAGAVKIKLHRARERLRQALAQACEFETDERGVRVCQPKRDPADS